MATAPSPAGRDLAAQLRRALLSIVANIAEGAGSATAATFARYLGIAEASAHEAEALVLVARDAGLMAPAVADPQMDELRQLRAMLAALRRRAGAGKRTRTTPPPPAP
ncbi:MAG: four helix bundle protein [Gemmatimonadota bacterium]|nr:four helix bundle protein [Gemmatimonadota bacterium]